MKGRQISLIIILILLYCSNTFAQQKISTINVMDSSKEIIIAEVSCGECQFKMNGKSCDLAVRINGKCYFVEGTSIDDHGDAHSKDGFCESIKKAEIQGEPKNGRFIASYFKIINKN